MSAQLNITSNTWKSYFQNLATNGDANKNVEAFGKCTTKIDNNTDFEKTLLSSLSEDPNTVIMAVAPVTGKMKLYHSITNLGGTRCRTENVFVGLEGFGPSATPIKFDMAKLKTVVHMQVPSPTDLLACTDAVSAERMLESDEHTFSHAVLTILPPMLFTPYLELDTRSPSELLTETVSIMTMYDESHKDDPEEMYPKAKENCAFVLQFLWAAINNRIPHLTCLADSDDAELTQWGRLRHHNCILPAHSASLLPLTHPPPGLPPLPTNTDTNLNDTSSTALHELSGNIKNQTEVLERMRQDRSDENKEKSHKFVSLHESTKRLILNASSLDGESVPTDPEQTCRDFYAKTTVGKALDFLAMTLKEKYRCVIDISTGLVSALYTGKFIRDREDSPNNFSFFMVPKLKPLSSGHSTQAMILQLKATQGKGWSENDLKEAVKQGIVTPSSPHELQYQLQNLWGLACFFFGPKSKLPSMLGDFILTIERHSLILEAKHMRDSDFCTKVGYAVDNRIFRWLENCGQYEERDAISDNMINFGPIMEEILFDKFHQILPLTFSIFNKRKKEEESPPTSSGNSQTPNKKIKKSPGDVQKIVNPSTIEDWLCTDGATYSAKFAGKNSEKRPKMHGTPICTRWHTKGYCFSNCNNISTHVPSTDLDQVATDKYKEFVDMCRS